MNSWILPSRLILSQKWYIGAMQTSGLNISRSPRQDCGSPILPAPSANFCSNQPPPLIWSSSNALASNSIQLNHIPKLSASNTGEIRTRCTHGGRVNARRHSRQSVGESGEEVRTVCFNLSSLLFACLSISKTWYGMSEVIRDLGRGGPQDHLTRTMGSWEPRTATRLARWFGLNKCDFDLYW